MSNKAILIIVLISIQIIVPMVCQAENTDLRNIPLHQKKIYNQIEFLEVRGHLKPILAGAKPLTYGQLRRALKRIDLTTISGVDKKVINSLLAELKEGTSIVNLGDKKINLASNIIFRYPSDLFLESKFDQETQVIDQPHYIIYSKLWAQPYPFLFGETGIRLHQGSSEGEAHIPSAYAKVDLGFIECEAGEDAMRWGPGHFGSLSISGNSRSIIALGSNERFLDNPEMDIFKAEGKLNNVKITYFTARDGAEWGQFASSRLNEPFLSGLRADFKLGKYLEIGIGDVAVSYDSFEFGVLVKDPLAYFTNLCDTPQKSENINVMGTCDLTLTIPKLGRVYGEYIWDSTLGKDDLDDYNAASAGRKTGFLVGAYVPFKTDNAVYEARVEHTVIEDTVYTFPLDSTLEYKYKDRWLGHWAGPDSKTTVVEFSTYRVNDWEGAVRFTNIYKGVELGSSNKTVVTTMEIAKNVNKNFKVIGYLQHSDRNIKESTEENSFGLELKFDL